MILSALIDFIIESPTEWKTRFEEYIKKATREYNKSLLKESELTPIAREVSTEVMEKELFGCQRGNTLRILRVMMKENLREYRERMEIPLGSLVKTRDTIGINVGFLPPTRRAYIYGPGGGAMKETPIQRGPLLPLEEEEIEEFLKKLQPNRFLKGVSNGYLRN